MSYSRNNLTEQDTLREAEKRGCIIEKSDDRTLQLDLDSLDAYVSFLYLYDMAVELGVLRVDSLSSDPAMSREVRRSQNNNRHVTIRLKEPTPVGQRIFLQALLGSDPKREMLSYTRWKILGQENPICLFRPKDT